MSAQRVLWIFVASVVVVGVTLVPLRSLDSPAWDVWVTDQSGHPVSGITVRVAYQNYSAENKPHETDALTDALGHAAFSAQTLSASLGRQIVAILSSLTAGVHAGFGPHATVFAFGEGLLGFAIDEQRNVVVDWTGKPDHMESRIIAAPPALAK
jgi:hypothetical protein